MRDYSRDMRERIHFANLYIGRVRRLDCKAMKGPFLLMTQVAEYHARRKTLMDMAQYHATTALQFWYLWRKYNLGHDIVFINGVGTRIGG